MLYLKNHSVEGTLLLSFSEAVIMGFVMLGSNIQCCYITMSGYESAGN